MSTRCTNTQLGKLKPLNQTLKRVFKTTTTRYVMMFVARSNSKTHHHFKSTTAANNDDNNNFNININDDDDLLRALGSLPRFRLGARVCGGNKNVSFPHIFDYCVTNTTSRALSINWANA